MFAVEYCQKTCKVCDADAGTTPTDCADADDTCVAEDCAVDFDYMKAHCAKTCDLCGGERNVVDALKGNPEFSIFFNWFSLRGWNGTLTAAGPWTVLAPTNAAFTSAVNIGLGNDFTNEFLKYSIISGNAAAEGLKDKSKLQTQSNDQLDVVSYGGKLHIGYAQIGTGLVAANGVVLPISQVLVPPARRNVAQYITSSNFHITLSSAMDAARVLANVGPTYVPGTPRIVFTMFAPTDAAFTAQFTSKNVATPVGIELKRMLLYHIVRGSYEKTRLTDGLPLETLNGAAPITVTMAAATGLITVSGATNGCVLQDQTILTGGEVVHDIGCVLVPPVCVNEANECTPATCATDAGKAKCAMTCQVCLVADCTDIFDNCDASKCENGDGRASYKENCAVTCKMPACLAVRTTLAPVGPTAAPVACTDTDVTCPDLIADPATMCNDDSMKELAAACPCRCGLPECACKSPAPTAAPTAAATEAPTEAPTAAPTPATQAPTEAPTAAPTAKPTEAPTAAPTPAATPKPTAAPTHAPSALTPVTPTPAVKTSSANGGFTFVHAAMAVASAVAVAACL